MVTAEGGRTIAPDEVDCDAVVVVVEVEVAVEGKI